MVKKQKTRQNSKVGFPRFDLPLLATYSRRGTNWVRYFLEVCSNQPTPGQTRYVEGTDYFIDRAHCAYPVLHKYSKVILLLRDFKECLLRHNKDEWLSLNNVEQFLDAQDFQQPCEWYIKNIEAFDNFKGPKLLLYYEDLMQSPANEFTKLAVFLSLSEEVVSRFIDNIDKHFHASVAAYTAGGHASETAKTKDLQAHARKLLTDEQKNEFDRYYLRKYPSLTQEYLKRYITL